MIKEQFELNNLLGGVLSIDDVNVVNLAFSCPLLTSMFKSSRTSAPSKSTFSMMYTSPWLVHLSELSKSSSGSYTVTVMRWQHETKKQQTLTTTLGPRDS
jgi:hypothetical protein